jgi:hypothetical protein
MTPTVALSGTSSLGTPPIAAKALVWGGDPVAERLRPARLGVGEVRGAEDGDKDLRRPGFAGQSIDEYRHRVAGVVDEQLVAAGVGLTHRHRQPRCPAAVQLAKAGIAVPVRAALDVLVPQHRQRDVLALQLAMNLRPIRLGIATMTLLGADRSEEPRLQQCVGHLGRQRPDEPRRRKSLQRQSDGRWRQVQSTGNLIAGHPGGLQAKHFAHMAHRGPLCWHPLPPWQKSKGGP